MASFPTVSLHRRWKERVRYARSCLRVCASCATLTRLKCNFRSTLFFPICYVRGKKRGESGSDAVYDTPQLKNLLVTRNASKMKELGDETVALRLRWWNSHPRRDQLPQYTVFSLAGGIWRLKWLFPTFLTSSKMRSPLLLARGQNYHFHPFFSAPISLRRV